LAHENGLADGETEHMGEMLEVARKQTFRNYHAILQDIHEKPSIIAQTYRDSSDGRPVVSLRSLYLCLQCPNIMTEADRDEHIDVKRHVFCAFFQGWGENAC
jgi:ubiquitin carboxyl-terminal hydrolase 22/27/51